VEASESCLIRGLSGCNTESLTMDPSG
jgi:hypothetical protein